MKSIVRQKHIEWLEQQIETCQSVINNQALRKITLIEALENAKGNSGSATLVEVPTATATATAQAKTKVRTVKGLTKAERKIWRLLGNTDLSSAELAQKAKLKISTVHSTIWSLRKKLGFSVIVLKDGRYTLAGEFQRTGS